MGKASEDETGMLTAIKVLHTVVWALLAGAIVALPFLAGQGAFRWAAIFSVVIFRRRSCAPGKWVEMPDDGSGSEIHRRPVAELRYLYAELAGPAQQDHLYGAFPRG
jgi:hypothetical protein